MTTIRTGLSRVLLLGLLLGLGNQATAQFAVPDEEAARERTDRILANLKYQIQPLREASVVMGDITPTNISGMEIGSFSVNGQTYSFLVTADDVTLFLLGADPIDVSLSSAEIAAAMDEEARVEAMRANERREALNDFSADMPIRGNPDAPVTIVEFSDFECPYCSRAFTTVEQILEAYPADVKLVYLNFPLPNHPWARPAAIASVCAAEQSDDAFWILHDGYFSNQQTINLGNVLDLSQEFLTAGESDIDMDDWSTCARDSESEAYQAAAEAVAASLALGNSHGVSGTPGFFVNGVFLNGALPFETFQVAIDEALQLAGR